MLKLSEIKDKYNNKSYLAFLLGIIVGVIVFIVIYGTQIIHPTNTEWLLHSDDLEGSIDLTQHYMGWVFYRDTPWTFPLGLTEGIYSEPVSVVYTDSIPLFALFFKVFSGILPDSFQYMGIFGLVCYALMGGFGALITRRNSSNAIVNALSALFFVISPIMLNRMYLHTALSAHFLIVAGIVLWLYRDKLIWSKYVLSWIVLVTCGTLINAYFTPILLGILLCATLQDIICGGKIGKNVILVISPVLVTLFGSWIMGMFYGETNASGSGGLDMLSFNLNGFFNPMTYATDFGHFTHDFRKISYSGILRGKALLSPYQNEGFAYLGFGMIILVIIAFVLLIAYLIRIVVRSKESSRKKIKIGLTYKKRKAISFIVSLLIFFVVFTLLAMSPKWTIGDVEILNIPWSDMIWNLLSTFRSTGRFIWPVYYMIMTLALIIPSYIFARDRGKTYASKLLKGRRVFVVERRIVIVIMLLTVIVQIIDLYPAMKQKHIDFHKEIEYASDLQSPLWEIIAKNCDKIIVCPPSVDLYWDGISALTFEIFAKEHDMTMNMTYMSRDLTDFADEKTREEFDDMAKGKTYSTHMYLFLSAKEDELPDGNKYNLNYYSIDGYIVGLDKSITITR